MKKQLLKALHAFNIMMLFTIGTANAQIIYTDVIPDVVRGCTYPSPCAADFLIDLNNDGINDFTFAPTANGFSCGSCFGGAASLGTRDSALVISTALSWIADTVGGFGLNKSIDSTLAWTNNVHTLAQNGEGCLACGSIPRAYRGSGGITGTFINVSGKYVGLKVKVGSDFYYGWIKLGVSIASYSVSITIMEYAYNSTPNQPILAGQTMTTGIIENSLASSINLFPNPADNHLTIDLGSNSQNVQVTIADITGNVIYTTIATDTERVEVNTQDFAEGMYVVQIQAEDFIGTKKFVVAN